MKKVLLTIFLFTYLFSSIGFTAAIHFCEMKMRIVDASDQNQCCQNMEEHQSDELACCAMEEETINESSDCCSIPHPGKSEQPNKSKTGIESNCCKDIDVYRVVENSLKVIELQIEAIQLSGQVSIYNEFIISENSFNNSRYNTSIDHINRPLLI